MRTLLLFALVAVPEAGEPLPPPREGEWRAIHDEPAQTFLEYRDSDPVRATEGRDVVYVQPFLTRVPSESRVVALVADHLAVFHGRRAKVLDPRPMPRGAYDAARRSVHVPALLRAVREALPADALFVLAVTDRDLHAPGLAWTFGWASMEERVGVISTARIGAEHDARLARRRLLGLAAHETGHLLSIPHCPDVACLMNGAATVEECDRRPMLLCPSCREKLCWNLGLDPASRALSLAGRLEAAGLAEDAAELLSGRVSDILGGFPPMDELNYRRLVSRPKVRCEACGATSYQDPHDVFRCVVCDHERFEICLDCGQLRGWCECAPVEKPASAALTTARPARKRAKK